jgi:regulator of sigma E protease
MVVFAGPMANLVLPVFIYFIFFAGHTELPAAVVGDVITASPAAQAGIVPGDRLLSLDGDDIRYFEDLERRVQSNPGRELRLRIRRGNREFERFVVPVQKISRKRDGTKEILGSVGITWAPFLPQIGVIDKDSPAGRAGLRTGDLIISIDGRDVPNWSQLQEAFEKDSRRRNVAYFRGTSVPGIRNVSLLEAGLVAIDPQVSLDQRGNRTIITGFAPAEMVVASVVPMSPADLAGLRPGDLITTLDDQPMRHWMLLDQELQRRPDHTWKVGWLRASNSGEVISMSASLKQQLRRTTDEYGNPTDKLVFGAHSNYQRSSNEMIAIDGRFGYATLRAVARTGETIAALTSGFFTILRGQAPHEAMGGPMMMFRAASVSGSKGWDDFLLMIALLSVSVGLLNLLPIPTLDGGHLLLFAVEAFRGKALSPRARDRISVIGLSMVGLIIILAVKNDVTRFVFQ